jgi:hypothetical protein
MKRLRELFESIVYAGMKPGVTPSKAPRLRWLGPLHEPIERFLNGPSSADPFYLTNRTVGQKVRVAALIAMPCLLVLVLVGMALASFNRAARLPAAPAQMSNAEIAAKMLPDLNKDLKLPTNVELEVVSVEVLHTGGSRLEGTVRNNTDHVITNAEAIFDLTNASGSRLGAVSCKIDRIEPKSLATFHGSIEQTAAAFAIVREVRAQ